MDSEERNAVQFLAKAKSRIFRRNLNDLLQRYFTLFSYLSQKDLISCIRICWSDFKLRHDVVFGKPYDAALVIEARLKQEKYPLLNRMINKIQNSSLGPSLSKRGLGTVGKDDLLIIFTKTWGLWQGHTYFKWMSLKKYTSK